MQADCTADGLTVCGIFEQCKQIVQQMVLQCAKTRNLAVVRNSTRLLFADFNALKELKARNI